MATTSMEPSNLASFTPTPWRPRLTANPTDQVDGPPVAPGGYWIDVRPAIRTRRVRRQEDAISYFLRRGLQRHRDPDGVHHLGEAGMLSTHEFPGVAAWHLQESPALRARFAAGGDDERQAILGEILRLQPVDGHLVRTATAAVTLLSNGQEGTIAAAATRCPGRAARAKTCTFRLAGAAQPHRQHHGGRQRQHAHA